MTATAGPAPDPERGVSAAALLPLDARRLRMYRGGFWLVILAESFGFLTLFAVRFLVAGTGHPAELNLPLGTLITFVFAASAVAAAGGLRAIRAGDMGRMTWGLNIALGLGLVALWFVVAELSSTKLDAASRFGGAYLATTGFHAIHIVVGLIFLAALRSSGRRGRFSQANHWLVEAGVRFWLFVAAAWLALYVVFFWL